MPLVTGVRQVCLVVEDFDATVGSLARDLGIGPWKCWAYDPVRLFERRLDGREQPWTMKLGLAWVGRAQLEVIAPIEGDSIYRRYLAETPEGGAQHVMVATGGTSYRGALARMIAAGFPVAQSAKVNVAVQLGSLTLPKLPRFLAGPLATRFAFLDSREALGTTIELSRMPPGISFERGMSLGKPDWVVEAAGEPLFDTIDSVGLVVTDLEAAGEQWMRVGFPPFWPRGGDELGEIARCDLPPTSIELIRPSAGGPLADARAGVQYVMLATRGALDAAVERVVAAGGIELFRADHPQWGATAFLSQSGFGATRVAVHAAHRS